MWLKYWFILLLFNWLQAGLTIQYSPEETKKMTKKSGAMEALEVIPEVGPLLPVAKGHGLNLQHRRLNRGRRYVISISVWKPSSTIYKLESEKNSSN